MVEKILLETSWVRKGSVARVLVHFQLRHSASCLSGTTVILLRSSLDRVGPSVSFTWRLSKALRFVF